MPDATVKHIIFDLMKNFPEASNGMVMKCLGWNYKKLQFDFGDSETGVIYHLNEAKLTAAFKLMFTDDWPKGCTQPPPTDDLERWNDWLGNADATDFDAFIQLACLGEVIYG